MSDMGNAAQVRIIAEQVVAAAFIKYASSMPAPKAEIPTPLKWAGIIAAAVLTLGVTGGVTWGVSTLNELQITVARMDERQRADTTGQRLDKIEERLTRLEQAPARDQK